MKKLYVFIIFTLVTFLGYSQESFEGEISYVKTSYSDTLYYVYTIKDDCVRIDEYDKYRRSIRAYIIYLQDQSVMVINPSKKVYTQLDKFPSDSKSSQNMEVIHTGNYKYVNGYKCSQWRVKNYDENTEITYWMAGENFNFYIPMSQVTMSLDDQFLFFKALPLNRMGGVMPMMIESKTLLRAPKSTISIVSINSHDVDASVFSVSQYQKYESLR